MRAGIYLIMAYALLLPVAAWGTTLHLAGDVDLLVLDGKKVSSYLLKGADSIELENGPHQLVFRVEKTIRTSARKQRLYISPPLIISFDTKAIGQVSFALPDIKNEKEGEQFTAAPQVQLLDGNTVAIAAKLDFLTVQPGPSGIDYETDTRRYNQADKPASMPAFAIVMMGHQTLRTTVSVRNVHPSQPVYLAQNIFTGR